MERKIDYDKIPVEFCKKATCCSLAIIEEDELIYCKDCGGTKIDKGSIETWEEYYFMAHGTKFIDNGNAKQY